METEGSEELVIERERLAAQSVSGLFSPTAVKRGFECSYQFLS